MKSKDFFCSVYKKIVSLMMIINILCFFTADLFNVYNWFRSLTFCIDFLHNIAPPIT